MRQNALLDLAVAVVIAHPLSAAACAVAAGWLSWLMTRPRNLT